MLTDAFPANATPLPYASPLSIVPSLPKIWDTPDLAAWAASVGRTAADVAALTFCLPIPGHLKAVFEDSVRQEVSAELLGLVVDDEEATRLETIAWLAFDRRLALHVSNGCHGSEG